MRRTRRRRWRATSHFSYTELFAELVERLRFSQQTLSEWERGERVHITTAMLNLASHLTSRNVKLFLERPTDAHSMEGRVFWLAVEAELAARQTGATRPTVPEILKRAAARVSGA